MTDLADQVHTSISGCEQTTGPAGFACTAAAAQLWSGLQPPLLAAGAMIAQFGDDLNASGTAWSNIDAANARHFQPPGGR